MCINHIDLYINIKLMNTVNLCFFPVYHHKEMDIASDDGGFHGLLYTICIFEIFLFKTKMLSIMNGFLYSQLLDGMTHENLLIDIYIYIPHIGYETMTQSS